MSRTLNQSKGQSPDSVITARQVKLKKWKLEGLGTRHPVPGLVLQHGIQQLPQLTHTLSLPGRQQGAEVDALSHRLSEASAPLLVQRVT